MRWSLCTWIIHHSRRYTSFHEYEIQGAHVLARSGPQRLPHTPYTPQAPPKLHVRHIPHTSRTHALHPTHPLHFTHTLMSHKPNRLSAIDRTRAHTLATHLHIVHFRSRQTAVTQRLELEPERIQVTVEGGAHGLELVQERHNRDEHDEPDLQCIVEV